MKRPHLNRHSLGAIVTSDPRSKSQIARDTQVTPGHLHDLLTGRRYGTDPKLRQRLADALGVDVEAVTCRCTDSCRRRRGVAS